MASVRFPDILRVETIKDPRFQVMPPHDNHNPSLREMHALLQEMKTINDECLHAQHDLDHLEWEWSSLNPLTHIKNYRDNKASKADAWTQTLDKWAQLSLKTKRDILKYVVEHDVKDAWTCFLTVITDKAFKSLTTDEQKKTKINETIDRNDSSTDATIENIVNAFTKKEALKTAIIIKVRDSPLDTPSTSGGDSTP